MAYEISKRHLTIIACVTVIESIWIIILIHQLSHKNIIDAKILETIAACVCAILLLVGIIGVVKNHKETNNKNTNLLTHRAQYIDTFGSFTCFAMQILTAIGTFLPTFFNRHANFSLFHQVTDIIGVGFFCAAFCMILTDHFRFNKDNNLAEEALEDKHNEKQEEKIFSKNVKIILTAVMLTGMMFNLTGKIISSSTPQFKYSLLIRIIGLALFTSAFVADCIKRTPSKDIKKIAQTTNEKTTNQPASTVTHSKQISEKKITNKEKPNTTSNPKKRTPDQSISTKTNKNQALGKKTTNEGEPKTPSHPILPPNTDKPSTKENAVTIKQQAEHGHTDGH